MRVFQQRKIERLLDMGRRDAFGQMGCEIDGQLFIGNRVIEDGFGDGFQVGQFFLLLLFGTPCHGEFAPEILIRAMARHLMREFHGLKLGAVHQNDAAFGVRIDLKRMIGAGIERTEAFVGF